MRDYQPTTKYLVPCVNNTLSGTRVGLSGGHSSLTTSALLRRSLNQRAHAPLPSWPAFSWLTELGKEADWHAEVGSLCFIPLFKKPVLHGCPLVGFHRKHKCFHHSKTFIVIPTPQVFLSPVFCCHIFQVFDQPERGLSTQYLEM